MTDEQIIKKAIEKAERGGFKIGNLDYKDEIEMGDFCDGVIADNLYSLIFDHEEEPLKYIKKLLK